MGVLQLRLLGGFHAERGQGVPPVERWARPGARTLVKLLAVTPGHQLHRERVMAVCWPHAELAAAQRNLRVALHAARHALEPELAPRAPSSYLVADGTLLRLAPGAVVVDADRAEALAERALAAGSVSELARAWAEFTGELLPEDRYAAWAEPRRARLADLRDRVGLALATARLAEDSPEEAAAVARHLADQTPPDERAHRLLMVAYVRQGRYGEAVRQYERCAGALAAEHGGLPGPETERLRRAALAGRRAPAGPVVVRGGGGFGCGAGCGGWGCGIGAGGSGCGAGPGGFGRGAGIGGPGCGTRLGGIGRGAKPCGTGRGAGVGRGGRGIGSDRGGRRTGVGRGGCDAGVGRGGCGTGSGRGGCGAGVGWRGCGTGSGRGGCGAGVGRGGRGIGSGRGGCRAGAV
ncbi:BTAD domain-containing putative transcriptional regulator [Streptomyces sp. NPDC005562]|uniref:AfsR/SARP family transcriptional regulator n=1 Tax=Streptomyces sp. NPDC005562 TaxID=3154890 RepID=UPI0033AE39B6